MCGFSAQYTLGLFFLLLANIIWAAASLLQQYIYDDLNFTSPFVLTYIGTSVFLLFLPLHELAIKLGFKKLDHQPPSYGFSEGFQKWYYNLREIRGGPDDSASGHLLRSEHASESKVVKVSGISEGEATSLPPAPYTHFQAFEIACIIAPAWFLSNLMYNYSLFWTTITSSTVLSNLSAAFTLFMAWKVDIEKVSIGKVVGVFLSFAGAIVVTLNDSGDVDGGGGRRRVLLGEQGSNVTLSIVGDVMAIISAFLYGIYTVVVRVRTIDDAEEKGANEESADDEEGGASEEVSNPATAGHGATTGADNYQNCGEENPAGVTVSTSSSAPSSSSSLGASLWACVFGTEKVAVPFDLVLGYVGVLVIVTLAPVLIVQGALCLEDVCSLTAEAAGFILLLAVGANFFSEYLWARSMLLTTPTVATVGLSITIPLAYATDILIGAPGAGSLVAGGGALLVVAGFVFTNLEDDFILQKLADFGCM